MVRSRVPWANVGLWIDSLDPGVVFLQTDESRLGLGFREVLRCLKIKGTTENAVDVGRGKAVANRRGSPSKLSKRDN